MLIPTPMLLLAFGHQPIASSTISGGGTILYLFSVCVVPTSANDPVAYRRATIGLLDAAHHNLCRAAPPYRRRVLATSIRVAVPPRPLPPEMGSACWTMRTTRSFVFVVFLYSPVKTPHPEHDMNKCMITCSFLCTD